MAHVAATSSHLSAMPTHVWQSHPRSSSPSNLSSALPNHAFASGDHRASASSSTSALTSTSLPSNHIWHPLSSSLSQSPDLPTTSATNLSHLPIVSNASSSAPPAELDPLGDADAVFRNLLNLHIDAHSHTQASGSNISRSISIYAPPFHPSTPIHQTTSDRLASSSLNDPCQDPIIPQQHHFLQPSSIMTSSLMLSLQSSPATMPMPPLYATSHPNANAADVAASSRASPILRSPSAPPSTSQSVHSLPPISPPSLSQNTQSAPRIKNELYKTEICRSYAESGGFCKYGSKCQFAHGDEELRPVRRHPRYKTKLCRNFVTTGACPYDSRCRFIHAFDLPYAQASSNVALSGTTTTLSNAPASALGNHTFSQFRHHQPIQSNGPHPGPHVGDDYADSLHRLLTLSSSSASTASNHLDSLVNTINADQQSTSSSGDLQTDNQSLLSVLPTDQAYHADASAFQNYSDSNAIHQTFMHLNGADYDLRYKASLSLDFNPARQAYQFGKSLSHSMFADKDSSVARRFASDASTESLFSHSAATPRASPNGKVGSESTKGADALDGSSSNHPAASPTSRSRLPVFRNMASDDDDAP